MSHDTFETLASVYAVGALDGADRVEFEAHLAQGCARCAAILGDSEEALARLAMTANPELPPAHLKATLRRRLDRDPRARGGARRLRWAAGTAAAVIAVAAFTGAYVAARYEARLGQMARETVAARERLQRSEAALREQLALYRGALDLLRDPATRVVELRGQGAAARANGRVVWHDAAGGHLFVANLPPAPAGRTYAVWTTGAVPRPAGLLVVDAAGSGNHRIEPIAGAEAVRIFSVTLEPEGGVPAPTGPTVLASGRR